MSASLVVLIVGALITSTISGVLGMGGGILLLAIMASILDPIVVVPVHGVVQLVSNGTRTFRLLRHVDWRFFALYVPGLGVGAALGIQLYRGDGVDWFKPVVGAFVLAFLIWERVKPSQLRMPSWLLVPGGVGGGFLTVMVGATGPYLAAFLLRDDLERRKIVATKAAVQSVGHFAKIPAFLSVGFDYRANLDVILPLIGCAIVGTFVGTALLERMNERLFQRGFRIVLAALGLRLLWQAVR